MADVHGTTATRTASRHRNRLFQAGVPHDQNWINERREQRKHDTSIAEEKKLLSVTVMDRAPRPVIDVLHTGYRALDRAPRAAAIAAAISCHVQVFGRPA